MATDLQVAVERFAKPWYRLRAIRVFRDDASMSANTALWSTIERGLTEAEWFVLLASPLAAQSEYVAHEVTWWREHKSSERILIVLEEGVDIAWDRAANDFDFEVTDSLPRALSGAYAEEPRWIDLRWFEAEGSLGTQDPRWMERVADVAAAVRGAERDELIGENVREHRRARRFLRTGVALLSLLLVASLVATVVALGQRSEANKQRAEAVRQRSEAVRQRDVATEQARIALARQLSAQAVSLAPTDLQTASLLAVQAYRTNQDAQTRAALFQIATASPQLAAVLPMEDEVTASAVTEDGAVVVLGDIAGHVVRWTKGEPQPLTTVRGRVLSLAMSGDGSVIAVAAADGVTLWRDGGATTLTGIGTPISVALDEAGTLVAASDFDGTALWTMDPDGSVLTSRIQEVGSDLVFADGFLVMVRPGGLWAAARVDPFEVASSGAHPAGSNDRFVLSADGLVAAGGGDTTDVPVWRGDATYEDQVEANAVAHFGFASGLGLALSTDGSLVAAQGPGFLQVASTMDPRDAATLPTDLGGTGDVSNLNTAALAFGGNRFLVSGSGSDALLWDLSQVSRIGDSFAAPVPIPCPICGQGRISISPDGTRVALWGLDDDVVGPQVVDLASHVAAPLDADPELSSGYTAFAWVDDDQLIAYREIDDSVVSMAADGSSPTVVATVDANNSVTDIVGAAGHAVLVDRDGVIVDVDLDTGATTTSTTLAEDPRAATAFKWLFAPDASSLAVVTLESDLLSHVVLVVDPHADRIVAEVPGIGAAYDRESRLHVFDGATTSVVVDDAAGASTPSGRVEEEPAPVVSPDGDIVVSGGLDGTVSLNDLARQGARFGAFTVPQQDRTYVVSAFTPDGNQLVMALPQMTGHEPSVRTLSLDPDDWIAAACAVAARDLTADDWSRYGVGPAPDDLRCVQ